MKCDEEARPHWQLPPDSNHNTAALGPDSTASKDSRESNVSTIIIASITCLKHTYLVRPM